MSDALNQVLETLKKQEETIATLARNQNQPQPDMMEKSGKAFKWIQALIALVAVVLSLGVSYGVTTSKLSSLNDANANLKTEISKQEGRLEAYKTSEKNDREKLENDVHELQLSQARDDQLFKSMEKTLEEMKTDVKKLLRRR